MLRKNQICWPNELGSNAVETKAPMTSASKVTAMLAGNCRPSPRKRNGAWIG
jgi:hypothetical protein